MVGEKLEKACKGECGNVYPVVELSKKGLCYGCAKQRMIEHFDRMWNLKMNPLQEA